MKDTNVIPKGVYCYDENGRCPYWSRRKDLPEQYNGFCEFLGMSDMDLTKEMELVEGKTGKRNTGDELPFPVSLLWDEVKECQINNEGE